MPSNVDSKNTKTTKSTDDTENSANKKSEEEHGFLYNFFKKFIEKILAFFGIQLGATGTGLNDAIKQPGAHEHVIGQLTKSPFIQTCIVAAFDNPQLKQIASDYMNANPEMKEFAQEILDDPRMSNLKKNLDKNDSLKGTGLSSKENKPQETQAQTNQQISQMSAVGNPHASAKTANLPEMPAQKENAKPDQDPGNQSSVTMSKD